MGHRRALNADAGEPRACPGAPGADCRSTPSGNEVHATGAGGAIAEYDNVLLAVADPPL